MQKKLNQKQGPFILPSKMVVDKCIFKPASWTVDFTLWFEKKNDYLITSFGHREVDCLEFCNRHRYSQTMLLRK